MLPSDQNIQQNEMFWDTPVSHSQHMLMFSPQNTCGIQLYDGSPVRKVNLWT